MTNWKLHVRNLDTGENHVIEPGQITTKEYTFNHLDFGRYTSWVRGYTNDQPVTVWSPQSRFYLGEYPELTGSGALVDAPTYITRQFNRTGTAVEFSWTEVSGASGYEFTLQHVQGQARAAYADRITGTSFRPQYFLPTGTYRAWVRAISAETGLRSRWSEMVEFTVAAADQSVDESPLVVSEVEIALATLRPDARPPQNEPASKVVSVPSPRPQKSATEDLAKCDLVHAEAIPMPLQTETPPAEDSVEAQHIDDTLIELSEPESLSGLSG